MRRHCFFAKSPKTVWSEGSLLILEIFSNLLFLYIGGLAAGWANMQAPPIGPSRAALFRHPLGRFSRCWPRSRDYHACRILFSITKLKAIGSSE
jgi:hypothetical protein